LILLEEAEKQNISVNALVNKILHCYAVFDRFNYRLKILKFPRRILGAIIQYLPDERLAEEGKKFGSHDAVDFFSLLGYPREYTTFIHLITEHLCSPSFGWFECFYHQLETQDLFHLQHNLGRKWSVFIDNYLKTILKEITDGNVETRIHEYAVTLKISRPPTAIERKSVL
jgi:hypothetical protein